MKKLLRVQKEMKELSWYFVMFAIVVCAGYSTQAANVDYFEYPVGSQHELTYTLTQGFNQPYEERWLGSDGVWYYGHTGIDLANGQSGGEVRAIAPGTVTFAGNSSGHGNMARIRHTLPSGENVYSQYGHMLDNSLVVTTGQDVVRGQRIGEVGTTGFSTNPHLHFEVKKINSGGPGYVFDDPNNDIVDYFDPLAFIKIGRFANMSSEITLKFVESYKLKFGVPFADVGGSIYVHDWNGVMIQNFQNDDETNRYGTDGQTLTIYNPDIYNLDTLSFGKAFLVKEGFWGYYKQNNGPINFGAPFTEEITAKYADSPFVSAGDYVQPDNEIVVQKFQQVGTADDFTGRRTLVYNKTSGQAVKRFPVGGFMIDFPLCLC